MSVDYDLVVIGAGSAGLVAAFHAKGLRKKVLLVNPAKRASASKFSNDLPFVLLARYAEHYDALKEGPLFSSRKPKRSDFSFIFDRISEKVAYVSAYSKLDEISKSGIDILTGKPSFVDLHTIKVGKKSVRANSFIIATGSSPAIPEIEGIKSKAVITTDDFFTLKALPASIVIVGAGASGCQFASVLATLGVKVALIEKEREILMREDAEVRALIKENLKARGVVIECEAELVQIEQAEESQVCSVRFTAVDRKKKVSCENVLLCCGRTPNTKGLELDAIGVNHSPTGIAVTRTLQTNIKHIYACGDVAGPYYLTNKAEKQGAMAASNAFAQVTKKKMVYNDLIWGLNMLPQLGRLGFTEEEAVALYGKRGVRIYRFPYKYSMHGVMTESEEGFAKIICRPSGKIVGAHIFGKSAVELVHELQLAKVSKIPFYKLSLVKHVFPSYADVLTKPSLRAYIDYYAHNFLVHIVRILIPHRR